MTGDDVVAGDEPEARRVFDLDSPQLIAVAAALADGPLPLRPRPRARAAPVHRRGREPGRAAVRAPRRARREEGRSAGARFLQLQICFTPDRLEAFMAEAVATGAGRALRADPVDPHRAQGARAEVRRRQGGGHRGAAPRRSRAPRPAADQRTRLRDRLRARPATRCSLPGVARPALHLVPEGRGIAKLCQRLGIKPRAERDQPHGHSPAARGLAPSRSGPTSPSASSASASTRPAARSSPEELRDGDLSTVIEDAVAQTEAGADMLDVNAGIPLVDEAELLRRCCRPSRARRTCRSASTPR